MQPAEFFDSQCLYARFFTFRNALCHDSLNAGKRFQFWLRDDFVNGLLDEITLRQSKGGGLMQHHKEMS